jgi:tetratricopeptide (TPR) repeat protein
MTTSAPTDDRLQVELDPKAQAIIDIIYNRKQERYAEAEKLLWEALTTCDHDPHRVDLFRRLSQLCRLQRRWPTAEVAIRDAISVSEKCNGLIAPATSRLRSDLVKIFDCKFRNEREGLALARRAVRRYYEEVTAQLKSRGPAPEQPAHEAVLRLELALYFAEGDRHKEETCKMLEQILPDLLATRESIGAGHAGEAAKMLGCIYFTREDYRQASLFLRQAVELLVRHDPAASLWASDRLADCERERVGSNRR